MSKKQGFYPTHQITPSAPIVNENPERFQARAPPPTYEESQHLTSNFQHQQQQHYASNSFAHQQIPPPPPSYNASITRPGYIQHPGMYYRGAQYHQHQMMLGGGIVQNQTQITATVPKVVEFDPAARFNGKGGGSLTVPPPPPGYAPTPAQIAAMQGQPVILQKKKKSFF